MFVELPPLAQASIETPQFPVMENTEIANPATLILVAALTAPMPRMQGAATKAILRDWFPRSRNAADAAKKTDNYCLTERGP